MDYEFGRGTLALGAWYAFLSYSNQCIALSYIFMLGFQSRGLDLGITHSIHTHILLEKTIHRGGNHQNGGLTKGKPYIATQKKIVFLEVG